MLPIFSHNSNDLSSTSNINNKVSRKWLHRHVPKVLQPPCDPLKARQARSILKKYKLSI